MRLALLVASLLAFLPALANGQETPTQQQVDRRTYAYMQQFYSEYKKSDHTWLHEEGNFVTNLANALRNECLNDGATTNDLMPGDDLLALANYELNQTNLYVNDALTLHYSAQYIFAQAEAKWFDSDYADAAAFYDDSGCNYSSACLFWNPTLNHLETALIFRTNAKSFFEMLLLLLFPLP